MKISWNWLRELVELPAELGPKDVAARLKGQAVYATLVELLGAPVLPYLQSATP